MIFTKLKDLTNFYYPGKERGFQFTKQYKDKESPRELEDGEVGSEISDCHVIGFVGLNSSDRPYSKLIQHADDDLGLIPAYPPMKHRDLSELEE